MIDSEFQENVKLARIYMSLHLPAETRHNNNVIITPKRRRRFDVIMTLLLHHVPIGLPLCSG